MTLATATVLILACVILALLIYATALVALGELDRCPYRFGWPAQPEERCALDAGHPGAHVCRHGLTADDLLR